MGHGTFNTTSSAARSTARGVSGVDAFDHDRNVRAGRAPALHDTLNVKTKPRRECRDNADNPEAVPIVILVDVTASMGAIAGYVIDSLHKMVSVIESKDVVEHPSILFGAIGDAKYDRVPLQVGEFESSDELAEKHLSNIFKEGGGGGGGQESYELALWFVSSQVDTDHWEKRGQKGFLFIIGDDGPYKIISRSEVKEHVGIDIPEDMAIGAMALSLQEHWDAFCLRPGGTGHFRDQQVINAWKSIFPAERVIDVENWEEIVGLIAGTISVMCGLSLDDTLAAITSAGLKTGASTTALATVADSAALAVSGATGLAVSDDIKEVTQL